MRLVNRVMPLLLLLTVLGCYSAEERTKSQAEEQAQLDSARVVREMSDLASRHNAVADWPTQLKGRAFTINAEPILLRADHRLDPLLRPV